MNEPRDLLSEAMGIVYSKNDVALDWTHLACLLNILEMTRGDNKVINMMLSRREKMLGITKGDIKR